jgi:hypothetical protein
MDIVHCSRATGTVFKNWQCAGSVTKMANTQPTPTPRHHNHPYLGPSVFAGDPHGLVQAFPISSWAPSLIAYVIARSKWYDIVHTWYCSWVLPQTASYHLKRVCSI